MNASRWLAGMLLFSTLAWGCDAGRPTPSGPGVSARPDPTRLGTPSASVRADPAAGLVVFTADIDGTGRLSIGNAGGDLVDVDLPDTDVQWVSASGTARLLATGPGGELHIGTPEGGATIAWTPLAYDTAGLPGPAQFGAISPAGTRFVAGSGSFDATASFALLVVGLDGDRAVMDLDREPSGPPSWLGPDRIVIQSFSPEDLDEMLEIAPGDGIVGTRPVLYSPSASVDGVLVAGLDPDSSDIRVLPSSEWRAGGESAGERLPGTDADGGKADRLALDGTGTRVAVVWVDAEAVPIEVRIYDAGVGWQEVERLPLAPGTDRALIGWLE